MPAADGAQPGATAASDAAVPSCRSAAEALAFFDRLAPVQVDDLPGGWRGATFASGHPLDGVLERFGWIGKQFDGPDAVHPLLFRHGDRVLRLRAERLVPWLPALLRFPVLRSAGFARAARLALPLFAGAPTGARVRMLRHRGCLTAAILYDRVPIVDVLRRVDERTLLGVMDLKGMERPYFFLLERAGPERA